MRGWGERGGWVYVFVWWCVVVGGGMRACVHVRLSVCVFVRMLVCECERARVHVGGWVGVGGGGVHACFLV